MRKAGTLLSVYLAYMLEYRAELFLWALAGALPLILLGVWTEAARGGEFPLSPGEFARYFLMVFLVRQATVVWVVWEFERDVVEGRLSFRLLRPLDPFFDHLAAHTAERLARLPFVVLLTLLFFALFPEARFLPEPGAFLLGLGLTVLAFLLRYTMQYTTALLTFWTERATSVEEVFFLLYLFLLLINSTLRSNNFTKGNFIVNLILYIHLRCCLNDTGTIETIKYSHRLLLKYNRMLSLNSGNNYTICRGRAKNR